MRYAQPLFCLIKNQHKLTLALKFILLCQVIRQKRAIIMVFVSGKKV